MENPTLVVAAKAGLVVLGLATLVGQGLVVPLLASETAAANPEVGYLMGPGIGACVVLIGCFQVCLVCLWRLLSRVGAGTIFDGAGAGPVNVIAGCCALAAVLLVAALGVLGLNRALNGGLMLLLGGGALVAAGLTLLVLVLRRLLARATDLQAELVGLV